MRDVRRPERRFYGYHVASSGVLQELGVHLAGGRLFTELDRGVRRTPVAIMNRRAGNALLVGWGCRRRNASSWTARN